MRFGVAPADRSTSEEGRCLLNPKLSEQIKTPLRYQLRKDRCEGLFASPVSGHLNLRVIGFHLNAPRFDARRDPVVNLRVSSKDPPKGVTLVVTSQRWREYYQMDTAALAADGSYAWSTDVLREVIGQESPTFAAKDLVFIACTDACDDAADTLLLPVSIGEGADKEVTVVLRTRVDLSKLVVSVGNDGKVIVDRKPIGGSRFPTDRPIELALGEYLLPGINEVTFLGTERSSGRATAAARVRLLLP